MTEHQNQKLIISDKGNDLSGDIIIAPEVLEVIIGIAASKIDGVYAMQGSLATNVNEWLGRVSHDKGVSLSILDDGGLRVDLYCYVRYGVSVPKLAMQMQQAVKQQVLYMTDLELAEVNIHIVGMIPDAETELPTGDASTTNKEEEN